MNKNLAVIVLLTVVAALTLPLSVGADGEGPTSEVGIDYARVQRAFLVDESFEDGIGWTLLGGARRVGPVNTASDGVYHLVFHSEEPGYSDWQTAFQWTEIPADGVNLALCVHIMCVTHDSVKKSPYDEQDVFFVSLYEDTGTSVELIGDVLVLKSHQMYEEWDGVHYRTLCFNLGDYDLLGKNISTGFDFKSDEDGWNDPTTVWVDQVQLFEATSFVEPGPVFTTAVYLPMVKKP